MFKDTNVNCSEDWFCEDYTLLQENIFEMIEDFKKLSQNPKKPAKSAAAPPDTISY